PAPTPPRPPAPVAPGLGGGGAAPGGAGLAGGGGARPPRDGIPAYTLFTDRSARELTVQRPADRAALADVWGFGDRRIAEIGDELLELLRDFNPEAPSEAHPEPPLQPALAVLPASEHA
ncbi:MAG: hypothetical protein F4X76_10675, partial [Chloroflexi bacterium]|nr:hypothetical protein [Chloroflexota bacterium]